MTGARAMRWIVAMSLLVIVGLIGMLVAESAWDVGYFVLAMLPLMAGGVLLWRQSVSR